MADRRAQALLLARGCGLAWVVGMSLVSLPASIWTLVFGLVAGGSYIAVEETLEDSLCAELVAPAHHGMAFGVLATINGIGDFLSSIVVGVLWTAYGTRAAFGYSGLLFFAGAVVATRLSRKTVQA